MGSDEYTSVGGGGALKLKGAKVQKKKNKKKNKDKQVAKGLVAADNLERASSDAPPQDGNDGLERRTPGANDGPQPADEGHQVQKTESERRFQEIRKKRVRRLLHIRRSVFQTYPPSP